MADIVARGIGNKLLKRDIYVTEAPYNAKGDGVTDDTQAFLKAIRDANGRPVHVPKGEYLVSLDLKDEHVHLVGEGTLIHQKAKNVMKVERSLEAAKSITAISTVTLGYKNSTTGSPPIGVPAETNTKISISGSLVGITQGDLFHISSQDRYPFCTQMDAVKGYTINVWKAGFVPVHGIGLDVSGITNGGFIENDVVTGLTSGATAMTSSVSMPVNDDSTITPKLVFAKINGDFVDGESLQVNGVTKGIASGKPYIIMAGRLIDTYTTSPVLRKLATDKKFIIDGLSVKADGDVDSVVGSSNRLPAFLLMGVSNPVVKNFTVESAWTRCWQLQSCWNGDLDIFIKKLPDNANESESAYGYGVELAGATEGCKVRVNGGNCRHAFTTNVFWGGFQYMNPLSVGTIKHNTVHNSVIKGALSASFDTHEGAYFTVFENCRSIDSTSGLRNVTASGGFQNRGFGTVYRNCYDRGSVVGFIEAGSSYEAGFIHRISYDNCVAENYQYIGFQHVNNSISNNSQLEFVDCIARGNGDAVNAPYYQAGFYLRTGVITLRNCSSAKFNGAPFQFYLNGGRVNMIDCFADYFDSPAYSAGLRFDGAPSEFNLQNYKVRISPYTANAPQGMIRVAAGTVAVNIDGISCVNTATPPPLAHITGGSITINQRSSVTSTSPISTNGDAAITLTPRSSSPTQVWNSPLTVDRTITLVTTAGTSINGDTFRIVRTANATGSFNLNVGGLKNLTAGQWCEVTYNGTAWILTAFSSL